MRAPVCTAPDDTCPQTRPALASSFWLETPGLQFLHLGGAWRGRGKEACRVPVAWPAGPHLGSRSAHGAHPRGEERPRGLRPHSPCSVPAPPSQYHALGLLYHVRKNDRLAVSKMISKFTRHGLKSPFAYCMMIRVASRQLEDEDGR